MLELDGLTRRFGDVIALDDLSFTVEPGAGGGHGAASADAIGGVLGGRRERRGAVGR